MAGPMPNNMPINPDTTMVTVKVAIDGTNRRFKLALRDLGANVFPQKLCFLLAIPPDAQVTFERYSDSAGTYVTLDSNNPAIYKQLYRAAKAKLKLRIKATIVENRQKDQVASTIDTNAADNTTPRPRSNYLETVLAPQVAAPAMAPNGSVMDASLPNVTTETLVAPVKQEASSNTDISEKQNTPPVFHDFHSGIFCIDCNNCGNSIPNQHYHCSICDEGDFDLCMGCVENGISCGGDDHWLIKRTLQNGQVISSTTEILPVKKEKNPEPKIPEVEEQQPFVDAPTTTRDVIERTCNSCIGEFPNSEFVSCSDCCDFDLCKTCLLTGQHGHNPAHTFTPLDTTAQDAHGTMIAALCKPGRNVSHMAICDGCDKGVTGVRYKCLNCPDWDYCSDCIGEASVKHPGHRFAPLYEPIAEVHTKSEVHFGIYCDGPLCLKKHRQSYIRGIRYKCSICHDTDFCANCEAAPTHNHNRTHPLIKFKTPVKHVSVMTLSEKTNGEKVATMGDRVARVPPAPASTPVRRTSVKTASTETTPIAKSTNAATQVQTMADFKPVPASEPKHVFPKLDAHFVNDAITDGTVIAPDTEFTQVWTMINPGPAAWPAGCSASYTGGDWMLNVDTKHPASVSAIYAATKSNVSEAEVKPGESFDFEVTLRTPPKEGRVISYWRLKDRNGVAFGHKVWCDVSVRAPLPAEAAPKPASSYVAPSVKEEQEEETAKPQDGSGMIFPKLEKESPTSSVYETTKNEPSEDAAAKSPAEDLIEDIESLDLEEDETEDGFLTDEEYDILDASDEEFLDAAQKAVK